MSREVFDLLRRVEELEEKVTALEDRWRLEIPAMMCEHANEVPFTCRCPQGCYCMTHTCKNLRR